MSPDPITPETATLAALGLEKPFPPSASLEPCATGREVQDAAVLTWLAITDLRPAPGSIWRGIQSQILPVIAPVASRRSWQFPITYSGWAAAAALALGWWSQPTPPTNHSDLHPINPQNPTPSQPVLAKISSSTPAPQSSQEASNLHRELQELQQRLANATRQPETPGLHRPAILELRAPGQADSKTSQDQSAARLQQLVTRALQRDLILRDAHDPSAIILERGWPTASWLPPESGQTIRHLSFPANRWEELGLWKSSELFYDPATALTWAPAPDGLGYLGRVTATPPDPANFTKPRAKAEIPEVLAEIKTVTPPSGYLVSVPGSPDATLLLAGLPPVPEGGQQVVIASHPDGTTQRYQIASQGDLSRDSLDFDPNISSSSVRNFLPSDSLILSSLSANFSYFQVIQYSSDGSTPTVILTSGSP